MITSKINSLEVEPAYVLHTKPFSETSLIIKVLTEKFGVLDLIAKGAKRAKNKSSILQPFNPLLISWVGTRDLLTLKYVESNGRLFPLQQQGLINGLYVNELLYKLLTKGVVYEGIFSAYKETIASIALDSIDIIVLRKFEYQLLQILGYGIDLYYDTYSNQPIVSDKNYIFNPYEGLFAYHVDKVSNNLVIHGKSIVAFREHKTDKEDLLALKNMLRFAINVHLTTPLQSRMFFR